MAQVTSNFATTIPAPVNFVLMETLLSAARKRLPYFNGTLPGSLEKAQGAASVKCPRIENLTPATTALTGSPEGTAPAFGIVRRTGRPTITDERSGNPNFGS